MSCRKEKFESKEYLFYLREFRGGAVVFPVLPKVEETVGYFITKYNNNELVNFNDITYKIRKIVLDRLDFNNYRTSVIELQCPKNP